MPSILNKINNAIFPKTAAHEVGHALIASHFGVKVHSVEILYNGRGGVTNIPKSEPMTKDVELRVLMGGFVAEELAKGEYPKNVNQPAYFQDFQAAVQVSGANYQKIQDAIKDDIEYLNKPDIQAYSKYLVNVLEHKGEIKGDLIKAP